MWNLGFLVYETHLTNGQYDITMIVRDFGLLYVN